MLIASINALETDKNNKIVERKTFVIAYKHC